MKNDKKILVSACLAGVECRYDGKDNAHKMIETLVAQGRALLICPEEAGGLPTPRPACEIQIRKGVRKVISVEGRDCTEAFEEGARKALQIAVQNEVDLAILKAKSPSCGCEKIYDGSFSKTLTSGNGVTTQLLLDNGISVMNETSVNLQKIIFE